MKVTAIVPSAGTGRRMNNGLKKPYISLLGLPLLSHTLKAMTGVSGITQIIVPVFPGEEKYCEKEIVRHLSLNNKDLKIVAGGETRQDSVRRSLAFLHDNCDMVLIHDGARPLVTEMMIETAVNETKLKRATTMAVPVKDTITIVSREDLSIIKTLPRDSLYSIQTPQTFERELIVHAHNKAKEDGFNGTDDASLVVRLGVPVAVIIGSYTNIKVTTKEDVLFVETILKQIYGMQ